MNTLIVYDWYSVCSNCGRGADPRELAHDTEMGYEPKEGCHAPFDAIAAGGRYGEDFDEAVSQMRPDLPMIELLP